MSHLLTFLLAICVVLLLAGAAARFVLRKQNADEQSRLRLRELVDAAIEGLVVCENGAIKEANSGFVRLTGLHPAQLYNEQLASLVAVEYRQQFADLAAESAEVELITVDGKRIPVEITVRDNLDREAYRRVYAIQDVRERKRDEARIRHLAHHDPLTGVPNRVLLHERLGAKLEQAWSNDQQFAVFTLDLDRFKEVNDIFGHASGDAVLLEATRRMRDVLEPDDLLARVGGDEFAIVTGDCDPHRATRIAEQLVDSISQDVAIGEQKVSVAASIGIALFPSHGMTPERLLSNADVALYRAKAQGRSAYCFFNSEMDTAIRDRRALAKDLGQGLARGELEIHFQPQANVSSLAVTGFEALARWRHPERGFVSPGEFIPLAEENGLVHDLGLFVVRQACQEAAKWRNPLSVAVNISALQFQHAVLPHHFLAILTETGLPPARLELEITETVFIKDFDRALSMLRRLKALGLRIAMDDFGTGWSSLSTLQAFPFDRLKIDRTFIDKIGRRREAEVIIRTVLGLGRSLDIPVLAEGVETEEQLEFLRSESCDEIQGYLLAAPAPIETFSYLIEGVDAPEETAVKVA
jgi:diguanylate cyclase (GGDEF)-like protein/PAS domain S-box-containing protein